MANIGKYSEGSKPQGSKTFVPYRGVMNAKILCVNPTKAELDKIFGNDNKEPEYRGVDDKGKKYFDVMFVLEGFSVDTNFVENGKTKTIRRTLEDAPKYRVYFRTYEGERLSQSGKVLCIDKTGRTKWIDKVLADNGDLDELSKSHKPFEFLGFYKGYKKCCAGTDAIINMMKKYAGNKDSKWAVRWLDNGGNFVCYQDGNSFFNDKFDAINPVNTDGLTKKWTNSFPIMNEEDRQFEFDNLAAIAKGDIRELKNVLKIFTPHNDTDNPNLVKIMVGTRVNDKGYVSNVVYTSEFMYSDETYAGTGDYMNKYYNFERMLRQDEERGAHESISYIAEPAKLIDIKPTEFSKSNQSTIPSEYRISEPEGDLPY